VTVVAEAARFLLAGLPIWLPGTPLTNETPGKPNIVHALLVVLVKSMGTYVLPAAAPPCAVSTLTFSPGEAQPATPALAVVLACGVGWDEPGVAAGALDAAGVLDGVESALVPVVVDELHAAASSAVPSISVMPSA